MTEPRDADDEPITTSWTDEKSELGHLDAWEDEQGPETLVDAVTGTATATEAQSTTKDGLEVPAPSATDTNPEETTTGDADSAPFTFALTAAEVSALVSERARKLSAIGFKALVSAGEAPQPSTVEGKTPLWFLDDIELWIQDRYLAAVDPQPADGEDEFATFLSDDEANPDTDPAEGDASDNPDGKPELVYGSVAQWVHEFLIPVYRRVLSVNGSNSTWCPSWWMHAEAVIRLEALWRAWEHLRLDGKTGMSVFMKDHLDPHMAVLTDTKGPFDGCTLDRGHDADSLKPFPVVEPPMELFPDVREQTNSSQASPSEGE